MLPDCGALLGSRMLGTSLQFRSDSKRYLRGMLCLARQRWPATSLVEDLVR